MADLGQKRQSSKRLRCSNLPRQGRRFATDLLAAGCNIRTLQGLRGHSEVATTMSYTYVLNRGGTGPSARRTGCDGVVMVRVLTCLPPRVNTAWNDPKNTCPTH